MTSVEITSPPSTEGATQTRTIGVSFTARDDVAASIGTLTLGIDTTQNGSFRRLTGTEFLNLSAGEQKTVEITQFIGVQPPYDLRATVTFASSVEVTADTEATTTITVEGESEDTQEPLDVADTVADVRRNDATNVTPRVGPVEPITMSAEYQLPFARDTNQTACGETLQQQNGDLDWRIVFNGVVTLSQLDDLRELRSESGEVETRSAVFGVKRVTFDQLSVTRDEEHGEVEMDGTVEPLYEFQLQTKELSDQESGGLFG